MNKANLPSNVNTVKGLLDENQTALQEALPRHIQVNKLIRVVVTQLSANPKLQECTKISLISSILESALYGLEPDGKEAALVPFKIKNVMTCTFMPMYRGQMKLARRSGEIALMYAEIVRDVDEFSMEKGLEPRLIHKPDLKGGGVIIGAYAVYRLKSGEADFVWMNKEQVDKIRGRSKAKDSGPWQTDYEEMAKKTVIKRMLKMTPSEVEKQVDDPEVADNVYKALATLPLPSVEQEAEDSIAAPQKKLTTDQVAEKVEEDTHVMTGPAPDLNPEGDLAEAPAGADVPFPDKTEDLPTTEHENLAQQDASSAPNPEDLLPGNQG